jgi:hypothetical protein
MLTAYNHLFEKWITFYTERSDRFQRFDAGVVAELCKFVGTQPPGTLKSMP